MYIITGATGKVGKILVNELLAKGKKVRAIGRDNSRLMELQTKGATTLAGDVKDSEFVKKAFAGAEAVFCVIPTVVNLTDYRENAKQIARNYINAIKENKIKYAVLISSVGAHLGEGAGLIDRLADAEKIFSELKDVNVLNLRPTFFMENFFYYTDMITNMGIIGTVVKGDIPIPMVCTEDIGKYAAKRLTELNFRGNTTEYILGQRDLSYNEATTILGKAIGRNDLKYVQMKANDVKQAMIEHMGFSENVAKGMVEMGESSNSGKFSSDYKRTPQNTTPTSFEQFAKSFAEVFKMHKVTT